VPQISWLAEKLLAFQKIVYSIWWVNWCVVAVVVAGTEHEPRMWRQVMAPFTSRGSRLTAGNQRTFAKLWRHPHHRNLPSAKSDCAHVRSLSRSWSSVRAAWASPVSTEGGDTVRPCRWIPTFRKNMLPPSSGWNVGLPI
jgi:hypothetical protein